MMLHGHLVGHLAMYVLATLLSTERLAVGNRPTVPGLRFCPDLDSVTHPLDGGADPRRGWGRCYEARTVVTRHGPSTAESGCWRRPLTFPVRVHGQRVDQREGFCQGAVGHRVAGDRQFIV